MNRNSLYAIVAVLVVAVIGLGFYAYREQQKPDGVEIKIGQDGVSVQSN